MAAEPDDRDAGEVEHDDQRRHQERDQPVHRDRGVGQIAIGFVEPFALVYAAIEGADHAHPAQTFAQHQIQAIDLVCIACDSGTAPRRITAKTSGHDRHHRNQHPGQLGVLRQRQNHAADRHHRRGDHHGQHHDQHLLNLRRVVRGARDQRRGAEPVELVNRKMLDPREDRPSQDPPEPVAAFAA